MVYGQKEQKFGAQDKNTTFDPLVIYEQLPTEVLPTIAVPLVPVMHVARLCAAPLPRCGPVSFRYPLCKQQSEIKITPTGVRVAVANFFGSINRY